MEAVTVRPKAPVFDDYRGRSKCAKHNRERLAHDAEVDVETVVRWTKAQEPVPDDVLCRLIDDFGCLVAFAMNWEKVPRSEIPERWRRLVAEQGAKRAEELVPGECEDLLSQIEWRLRMDLDLDYDSPMVPRLQRLRAAVLEYLSEPCELLASEGSA